MSRVRIECYSSNNGKYLNDSDCFEGELLENFIFWSKREANEEWYIALKKELESRKGERHDQDILNDIFSENIDINFDFAKNLKLHDLIMPDCLESNTDSGKAMIGLCARASLVFIVTRRWFVKKDLLDIEFEVCHLDRNRECFNDVITNKILE